MNFRNVRVSFRDPTVFGGLTSAEQICRSADLVRVFGLRDDQEHVSMCIGFGSPKDNVVPQDELNKERNKLLEHLRYLLLRYEASELFILYHK